MSSAADTSLSPAVQKLRKDKGRGQTYVKHDITTERAWYRQPNESMQAYEAFMTYLTLPTEERSTKKVCDLLGKSWSVISKWRSSWRWLDRTAAYEEHYLLLRLESIEADRDSMYVEQKALSGLAMSIVEKHFAGINQLIEQAEKDDTVPQVMKHDALVKLFAESMKAQRLAVLGRTEAMAEVQEREERIAERWSQETAQTLRDLVDELGLEGDDLDRALSVIKRRFTAETSDTKSG